jgi:hypothetical protein
MTYFTEEQVKLLLQRIHPHRVHQRDGMNHVEGYDIRAELNRVFGFGRWSEEVLDQALICEKQVKTKEYKDKRTGEVKGGKDAWYVVYRTRLRLTIHAPDGTLLAHYDGSHVGESTHPVIGEAHGNALTNSETYALRRAAINLGDQFGLSLYNKGSMEALVRWTLVRPEPAAEKVDPDDVPQVAAEESGSSSADDDEPPGETETAEGAAPTGEPQSWLDMATERAAALKDEKAAGELWQETVGKARAHEISGDDKQRVLDLIVARVDDLRVQAMEQALMAISENDDWREKIRELADDEEARKALAEVSGLTADRKMVPPRAGRISRAITARWPNAAKQAEAAA